jgi:hypothetical protein
MYENAPATKLLATHCVCCNRPLVDAVSVELGIGPDCRAKYGFSEGPEANRVEANAIVHKIACAPTSDETRALIPTLQALGFVKLANKIASKIADIHVSLENGRLIVKAPYEPNAVRILASVQGRRWDKDNKANTYPENARYALWRALKQAYPGRVGVGPQGFFKVA